MLKLISSPNDEKPGVCMRFFILASSLMTFPTFMYWQVSRRPVGFASNKWTSRELQLKASKVADNSAHITWRPLQYLSYAFFSKLFLLFLNSKKPANVSVQVRVFGDIKGVNTCHKILRILFASRCYPWCVWKEIKLMVGFRFSWQKVIIRSCRLRVV